MDFGFPVLKLCRIETRRLIMVMGLLVGIVLVLQSSTLPYENVLLSLFPSSKFSLLGRNRDPSRISSSKSMMDGNYSSNSEVSDMDGPKKKHRDPNNGFKGHEGRNPDDSSLEKISALNNTSMSKNANTTDTGSALEMAREPEPGITLVHVDDGNSSLESVKRPESDLMFEKVRSPETNIASIPPALPPGWSSNNITLLKKREQSSSASVISVSPNISPDPEFQKAMAPTASISKMNSLLLQSHSSSQSLRPQWPSKCDQELLFAKSQIENSPVVYDDPELYPYIYRNVSIFKRSFEMMERILKVYIYKEGAKPIFHEATEPILKGIYASEGWFLKQMEGNKHFVVEDPRKAHLFYMPFSSRMLQLTLYVRDSHKRGNLAVYMKNYVEMIASKHPFWNRTGGADHFLVACHDWAPFVTRHHMDNCIKVLCNANIARDFRIGKDVTLPEAQVRKVEDPLRDLGGKPPAERQILAFFAGGMHGKLRPILLKYWQNDPDMKIFGQMPHDHKGMNYIQHMKSSRYCICAKGFDVRIPRVVESIFFECVPVFISDDYVPPFFEVLDWEAFAVFVAEKDVPKLKDILQSISEEKYLEMHLRVKKVQQHFLWHNVPVKYDVFHMILHSVWFNRLSRI